MMKKILMAFPLLLLFSFMTPGETPFNKGGVAFTVPDEWTITEEDDHDGQGYYLSCEKDGDNSSGLVTVSVVNEKVDLEKTVTYYAEELKKNFATNKATSKMGDVKPMSFNGIAGKGIDYSMTLFTIPHEGRIYSFHCGTKTVTVMVQEAIEDKEANKPGIDKIIASFSCK